MLGADAAHSAKGARLMQRIRDSFARQSLMTTLGAEMTEIGEGTVTIEAPILPIALQQHGFGHAGLTFSIGDSAAGYAALTLMPDEAEVMTVEMKINLLRPCAGQRLTATGRVLKPGRKVFVVSSDIYAENDGKVVQIATMLGTMIPM